MARKARPDNAEKLRHLAYRQLRECAERLGKSPTMAEFAADPHTTIHPQTIVKLHGRGGWNAAKRKAGLSVRRHATDEELLELLAQLGRELGRAPSAREINADPRLPSTSLYLHRFGTLREAQRRAGFDKATPEASAEVMLEQGMRLVRKLRRLPSWSDWTQARKQDPSLPSEWQVYRRFGGSEGAWRLFCYHLMERAAEEGIPLDDA